MGSLKYVPPSGIRKISRQSEDIYKTIKDEFEVKTTPLVRAILERNESSVKFQLRTGAILKNKYYYRNYGPLHFAASVRNYEIMEILIKAGADINALDDDLNSPLHVFLEHTKPDEDLAVGSHVAKLMKAGANVHQKNAQGHSPLHLGIAKLCIRRSSTYLDPTKYIDPDVRSRTTEMLAARKANLDLLKRWVKNIDANTTDVNGMSLLMHAVRAGNIEMAEILIKKAADPNFIDVNGMSALCYAVQGADYALTKFLVNSGAQTSILHFSKFDPLYIAFEHEDYFLVNFLMSIAPRLRLTHGYECLQVAVLNGWSNVVRELMNHYDIDVATQDSNILSLALSKLYPEEILERRYRCRYPRPIYEERIELLKFLIRKNTLMNLTQEETEKILRVLIAYTDEETVRSFTEQHLDEQTDFSFDKYPKLLNYAARNATNGKLFKFIWERGKFNVDTINFKLFVDILCPDNSSALKYLLKSGASANLWSEKALIFKRNSLLEIAITCKSINCVRILLSYGADVNKVWYPPPNTVMRRYKDYRYESPLVFAMHVPKPSFSLHLMRQIVLLEFSGQTVSQHNYETINSSVTLQEIYKNCKAELETMQITRIHDTVTFFNVLVNADSLLRDELVIQALADDKMLRKFPFYREILIEKLRRARKRPMLVEKAESVLMRLFECDPNKNYSLIFYNVVKFLKNRDLRNLTLVFEPHIKST